MTTTNDVAHETQSCEDEEEREAEAACTLWPRRERKELTEDTCNPEEDDEVDVEVRDKEARPKEEDAEDKEEDAEDVAVETREEKDAETREEKDADTKDEEDADTKDEDARNLPKSTNAVAECLVLNARRDTTATRDPTAPWPPHLAQARNSATAHEEPT